jgi:hypothetical protein
VCHGIASGIHGLVQFLLEAGVSAAAMALAATGAMEELRLNPDIPN